MPTRVSKIVGTEEGVKTHAARDGVFRMAFQPPTTRLEMHEISPHCSASGSR